MPDFVEHHIRADERRRVAVALRGDDLYYDLCLSPGQHKVLLRAADFIERMEKEADRGKPLHECGGPTPLFKGPGAGPGGGYIGTKREADRG